MEHLYFIALVAPPVVEEKVLSFKNFMLEDFYCKVALCSPRHIRLIPPFKINNSKEQLLITALNSFSAHQKPFTIQLQNFSCFNPRVIFVDVIPNTQLVNLRKELEQNLEEKKIFTTKKKTGSFIPMLALPAVICKKKILKKPGSILKISISGQTGPAIVSHYCNTIKKIGILFLHPISA